MAIEDHMKTEIKKLQAEISVLDEELERLHMKILEVLKIKKKKEYETRVLKFHFEPEEDKREFQTTLAKILKEA